MILIFDVKWPIKKYISNFKTQGFSYAPEAFVDILIELSSFEKRSFFGELVKVFLDDGNDSSYAGKKLNKINDLSFCV